MGEGKRGGNSDAKADAAKSMNEGGVLDVVFEEGESGLLGLSVIGEHELTMGAS